MVDFNKTVKGTVAPDEDKKSLEEQMGEALNWKAKAEELQDEVHDLSKELNMKDQHVRALLADNKRLAQLLAVANATIEALVTKEQTIKKLGDELTSLRNQSPPVR